MTKAEIDAKWKAIHDKVSNSYYKLPKEKQGQTQLLFAKFHAWIMTSWDGELIAAGHLKDTWVNEETDKEGVTTKPGTILRSQQAATIKAINTLTVAELTDLSKQLGVTLASL